MSVLENIERAIMMQEDFLISDDGSLYRYRNSNEDVSIVSEDEKGYKIYILDNVEIIELPNEINTIGSTAFVNKKI